jgi:hypothetical protein
VPLRFHLDEHVPASVASALRRRGIDVTTTTQANLCGRPDQEHIAYAVRESRVIYTQDADFLVAAAGGTLHAGIAYNAPNSRSIGQIIEFLTLLDACLSQEAMRNTVEFVSG